MCKAVWVRPRHRQPAGAATASVPPARLPASQPCVAQRHPSGLVLVLYGCALLAKRANTGPRHTFQGRIPDAGRRDPAIRLPISQLRRNNFGGRALASRLVGGAGSAGIRLRAILPGTPEAVSRLGIPNAVALALCRCPITCATACANGQSRAGSRLRHRRSD